MAVGPSSVSVAACSSVVTLLSYHQLAAWTAAQPPAVEPPLSCTGFEAWQVVGAVLLALWVGATLAAATLSLTGFLRGAAAGAVAGSVATLSLTDGIGGGGEGVAPDEPWQASPEPRAGGVRLPGLRRAGGRGTLA